MSAIHLDADKFEQEVLKSAIPVLVDFYADWCGPCKQIASVIDGLADEFEGRVKVCKLNIDQANELAVEYGVMSIPTLILFKDGENVNQVVGASKDAIRAMLKNS